MHQIRFRLGLRARPRWGNSQRSPRPPSWILGVLLLREVRGDEGKGEEGMEKGRGRKGRGWQGRGGQWWERTTLPGACPGVGPRGPDPPLLQLMVAFMHMY